ncbi:MAG: sulfurtransferase complex subunit TusB [Gammaproteobacteria bacterium]|nr:sulfurtransferase complex subunit TusB [Gammaproteobacteria bacterium]MYH86811.1 sulfurtransferase complex subunit TusB [Gammaproteobacteria bacterium]MYK04224.1 sulfurtransferase complex subunit TusB [Gammaproteobacteria bacterium]
MSCLHLLNKSPSAGPLDELCKALASGDGLLLLEDGAYFLNRPEELAGLPQGLSLYFLTEDLLARGLSGPLPANAATVDYDGFVALCASHHKTASWF